MEDQFLVKLKDAEKRDENKLILKNILGKGGYSNVYLGNYKINKGKKDVAIKMFKRNNRQSIFLFNNELNIFKLLNQENKDNFIVDLFNTLNTQRNCRLIMELGNMTLKRKINILFRKFNIYEATNMFQQIIKAIQYIHSFKIAHRDLKPENILLFENNRLKICDFGFAKIADKPLKTICGTVPYMAPELFRYNKLYNGFAVDVWAVGIIVFEILHNRLPFNSANIMGYKRAITSNKYIMRKLPNLHKALIEKCLTKNFILRPTIFDLIIPVKKLK
jgi:serine/threonine protein kinase